MNPAALTAARFAAAAAVLAGLIARHGHLRRLAGPLVVLIWQRVNGISGQVAGLLARMQAGTLRRYPARRAAPPAAGPRRRPKPPVLPSGHGWLVRLMPEVAVSGAHLQNLLADPDMPALLGAAPQLRRAMRPLCRMLGVRLPPPVQPPPDVPLRRSRPKRPPAECPRAPPFRAMPFRAMPAGAVCPPPSAQGPPQSR